MKRIINITLIFLLGFWCGYLLNGMFARRHENMAVSIAVMETCRAYEHHMNELSIRRAVCDTFFELPDSVAISDTTLYNGWYVEDNPTIILRPEGK